MKRLLLAIAALSCAVTIPVYAHHSFSAYYFEDRSVTIEGELVEFQYRSPHAWVFVMAKNSNGTLRRYEAEWSNPNRLQRDGITADTLKMGDQVIITGSPGRKAEEYKIHLKGIERPVNGWKWPMRGNRR